jgi:hypothetical protein
LIKAYKEQFVLYVLEIQMYFHCNTRLTNVDEDGHLYGVSGGSGGYAETIFRYAARALFNKEIEGPLDFKILRNSDFREVTLEVILSLSHIGLLKATPASVKKSTPAVAFGSLCMISVYANRWRANLF